MENQYCYKYPRPALTTDQVIFGFGEGELRVLLIRRGNEPFKGKWALPGGFMDMDEDAETCARRELEEETGLKVVNFEQLYAFSDVDRDPRYRVVSIAYYALIRWQGTMPIGSNGFLCPEYRPWHSIIDEFCKWLPTD